VPSGGFKIGQASRSVKGALSDNSQLFFLGNDYATHLAAINAKSSDTVRSEGLLSNLNVNLTSPTLLNNANKYDLAGAGNNIAYGAGGSQAINAGSAYETRAGDVRIYAAGGLFVAGGSARPSGSAALTGTFEYEGVFVSAAASTIGTLREGKFSQTVNFATSSFTFVGTTNAVASDNTTTQSSRALRNMSRARAQPRRMTPIYMAASLAIAVPASPVYSPPRREPAMLADLLAGCLSLSMTLPPPDLSEMAGRRPPLTTLP